MPAGLHPRLLDAPAGRRARPAHVRHGIVSADHHHLSLAVPGSQGWLDDDDAQEMDQLRPLKMAKAEHGAGGHDWALQELWHPELHPQWQPAPRGPVVKLETAEPIAMAKHRPLPLALPPLPRQPATQKAQQPPPRPTPSQQVQNHKPAKPMRMRLVLPRLTAAQIAAAASAAAAAAAAAAGAALDAMPPFQLGGASRRYQLPSAAGSGDRSHTHAAARSPPLEQPLSCSGSPSAELSQQLLLTPCSVGTQHVQQHHGGCSQQLLELRQAAAAACCVGGGYMARQQELQLAARWLQASSPSCAQLPSSSHPWLAAQLHQEQLQQAPAPSCSELRSIEQMLQLPGEVEQEQGVGQEDDQWELLELLLQWQQQ
jgi:hypothetical protein